MAKSELAVPREVVTGLGEKSDIIRVLHVDDDPALLKVAKECLQMEGPFEVETVTSVAKALKMLKEKNFDAVVSDYQMPEKHGLEFLKELRENGNKIPFIMFTGKGREEVAIIALNLGADRYLNKIGPPDVVYGELAHSVLEAVDKRRILVKAVHQAMLMENVKDAIIGTDEHFTITSWNKAAEEMYGWRAEEAIGQPASDILKTEFTGSEGAKAIQTLEETGRFRGDVVQYRKDGKSVHVESTVIAIRDGNDVITEHVSVNRDVTERLNMEGKLEETNKKLEMILKQASEGIGVVDANEKFVFANKAFANVLGCQENELVGMDVRDFVDKQGFREIMKQAELRSKGVSSQYDLVMYRTNGEPRLIRVSASPLLNEDGSFFGALAVISDLTERKKAESELHESEQKFKCLVEDAAVAIGITDLKGRLTYLNKALADLFGYSVSELLNKPFKDYLHPKEKGRLTRLFLSAIALRREPYSFEFRALRKDGQVLHLISKPTRLEANGKTIGFQAIIIDMTEQKALHEKLEESEEKYRGLVDNAPDVIILMDLKGNLESINKTAMEYGFDQNELIGKNILSVVSEKHWPVLSKDLEMLAKGKPVKGEVEIQTSQGLRIAEYSSSPIRKGERVVGIQAILRDTTERKKMQKVLLESEEKWRSLAENAPNIIVIVDRVGTIQFINRTVVDARPEEIAGRSIYDFVDPEHHNVVKKTIEQVFQTGEGRRYEISGVGPKGSASWYETHAGPIKRDGQIVSVTLITTDITERKKAEETLRVSLDRYRSLIEVTGELGWTTNANGEVVEDVPSFRKFTGQTYEEIKGWGWSKALHPDDLERTAQIWKEATATKTKYEVEYRLRRHDGAYRYFIARSVPVLNEDRSIREWVGTCIDITERKNAEKAIIESQQKFEALFKDNPEAAVYLDLGFRILDVNPRFCTLFGYSANEVKDKHINKVVVPEDKMEEAETLNKNAENGYVSHDTFRKRKDGSLVPVSISAAPVAFESKPLGYIGIYKDITELKRAQEESEESKRHFQSLFNLMADPVTIVDGRGKILEVTQKVEEITGFKKEELVGKNFLKTKIATAKTKAIMMKNIAKRMIGIDVQPYEVELLKKDGAKLTYEINAAKIDYKGKPADLVVFRDVTERKKLEEKLQVVGSLTRHDVRNKLSTVTGNVHLLRQKLAGDAEALERLNDMEAAIRNVETIFEFAAIYERLGVEQLTYVSVGKTVEEAASLFPDLKGVKMTNQCHGLTVLADSLLRQLLYNLIDNSLKYGEKTRQIKIYPKTPSADKLELIYEDDGVGIPNSVRNSLFKEGFTSGKGTGYGLFTIRRICEVYGWTIQETGKQGKGAQFAMSIPRISSAGKANYQIDKAQERRQKSETNMEVSSRLSQPYS